MSESAPSNDFVSANPAASDKPAKAKTTSGPPISGHPEAHTPRAKEGKAFFAQLDSERPSGGDDDDHDDEDVAPSGRAPGQRHELPIDLRQAPGEGDERLQKILARVGFGSRRKCEELILEGRVAVNGIKHDQLGAKANINRDAITVDGERIKEPKPVYFIINKPKGWYCTDDVPDKKILDLIPGEHPRLFTVGRLDKSCEGLMLATNDGRVANVLTHPRYKVPKIYKVIVKGHIKFEEVAQIERALFHSIRGGAFERIKVLKRTPKSSGLRLIVYEGLPPSFRDICNRFGHSVSRVTRVKVGPLELGGLTPGQTRKLAPEEVLGLTRFADEVESGKKTVNEKRLVTAAWIKQASERTPTFDPKEKGNRSTSSTPATGQKKKRIQMGKPSRDGAKRPGSGARSKPSAGRR